MFRIERLSLSEAIDRGVWRRLNPSSVYLSAEWLCAFDDPTVAECVVHIAEQGEELIAALVTHTMHGGSANTVYDLFALSGGLFGGAREDWRPQVLVGSRLGQSNSVLVRGDLPPEVVATALRELLNSAMGKSATGVLYAPAEVASIMHHASDGRLQPVLAEVGSVLEASHISFDDYVRSLPGSKRGSVRRDLRDFGGTMSQAQLRPDSAAIPAYARLMANVQARHDQPASLVSLERYLRRCASPGLQTIVFEARHEGRISAFGLGLHHESTLWMRVVGLTYDANGSTDGAYGHVLVYEPMKYAIEHGLKKIDLGAGVSSAKRLRGATGFPLWHLIQPPASVLGVVPLATANRARAHELGLAMSELPVNVSNG